MNQFIAKRLAAKSEANVNNGWKSNLTPLGSFKDIITEYGATMMSPVRQKEGNPFVSLYKKGENGNIHLDSLMFSNAVYAKHQKVAYDLVDLLDMPVYGVSSTEIATGRTIDRIFIGVEQGSGDELITVTDLLKETKSSSFKKIAQD